MPEARTLPAVDVVVVGFGWTGAIVAQELSETGLRIVAFERGGWRDTPNDFAVTFDQDELRYMWRHHLFQDVSHNTLTFRNDAAQTALPMRRLGSFFPGEGVGGGGVHWNGQVWRFLPTDFRARSHNLQRYGRAAIPADMTIADYPVSYEEIEKGYDKNRPQTICRITPQGRQRYLDYLKVLEQVVRDAASAAKSGAASAGFRRLKTV